MTRSRTSGTDAIGEAARLGRATYALSDRGREALGQFAEAAAALAEPNGAARGERAVA